MNGPVRTKQQLLDTIGVQEIVKGEMPEHDKDGIHAILTVVRGAAPFRRAKRLEAGYETRAISDEPLKGIVEIHL